MSDFDADSFIQQHENVGFDPNSFISAHEKSPGFWDGSVKSTVDALPMIGGVVGGILGTPADAVAGPMGNVVGAGIGGYVGTAAKNLINKYYDPQSAPKNMTEVMTQPISGGVEQGLMQGAGESVAPYISKGISAAGSAAKWLGTKALSSAGGVAPDIIKEYAQFSNRINSAPSIEKLKDIADEFVGKLASDVDAGKITSEQAQAAYKQHLSDLKDAYKTAGYDARDAVTSADQTLKDAHNTRIQQLSGDVYDSIDKLKSDVQSGSARALKTLDGSGVLFDSSPVVDHIDNTIANLKKSGTDESMAVAERLEAYKQRNFGGGGEQYIAASDAKKLIQGLDQTTTYSPMAGTFDKAKNAAFKGVRSVLDQSVKNAVPEYAKAMEPVAADADLLSRVSDFGDKASGASILQRINAPNQLERKAALTELGQKYGTDFVAGADPANLPEQAIVNRAQAAQDALRPDRVADKIDQTMGASRQKTAVESSQSALEQAKERLAPFKKLAPGADSQTTVQQKLAQLGKGGNIELTDMFQKLGKLTDTDFVQAMHDQNIQAAFKKGAYQGSRNAVRFGAAGGTLGYLIGGTYGLGGGVTAGTSLGGLVDQWGPAITKKILDGAIAVSKSPTAQTISSLEIPAAAKQSMMVGLQNYLKDTSQVATGALPAAAQNQSKVNRSPAVGEDKWAQEGIQKLGIQDAAYVQRLLQDPKAKQLLIQASDLPPRSKASQRIMDQLKKGWGFK